MKLTAHAADAVGGDRSIDVSVELKEDLLALIEAEPPVPASRFDELALRLWRWHIATMPAYADFCRGKLGDLRGVDHWSQIPPLPVEAFKLADISCGVAGSAGWRRFTTSGTTLRGQPGVALFDQNALEVMEAAVVQNAGRQLFGDGRRCLILVLAPAPELAPQVIMVHGMARILQRFGLPGSGFVGGPGGVDVQEVHARLLEATAVGAPVALLGASFAFVHLVDGLATRGLRLPPLPAGSRALDAGGYKGRSRVLSPGEFRAAVTETFAIPDDHLVNLLGMTELASQIYDDTLAVAWAGGGPSRIKRPPPWMRSQVLVGEDELGPGEPGQVGLIAHWDLANFNRPLALLSDDVGRAHAGGFEILGRAESSEQRGCSLRIDAPGWERHS
jgi:hypothetical protein